MNNEIKTVVKKTAKIAGVTCFALGGAALIASGAALKALVEGTKYARDSIRKILDEQPETEEAVAAAEPIEAEVVSGEEAEQEIELEEQAASVEEESAEAEETE